MLKLVYRPAALADLDAIYDFIEPENADSAWNFIQAIRAGCLKLCTFPQLGPARNDLGCDIRIYPMRGKIIVAYRIHTEIVEITRVFYGGQDYESILQE